MERWEGCIGSIRVWCAWRRIAGVAFVFLFFMGGNFPPDGQTVGPKKSPSGAAPEGLKSCERLEPSRRGCDGYDGDDNGGKAIRNCEGRFAGVVHWFEDEESNQPEFVQSFFSQRRPTGFGCSKGGSRLRLYLKGNYDITGRFDSLWIIHGERCGRAGD